VRDRRALVAADIGDARLQERLGDGEDALPPEDVAVSELQVLDLARERPFRHLVLPPVRARRVRLSDRRRITLEIDAIAYS